MTEISLKLNKNQNWNLMPNRLATYIILMYLIIIQINKYHFIRINMKVFKKIDLLKVGQQIQNVYSNI